MHYEITVSKDYQDIVRGQRYYKHLFSTAPRSCQDKWECKKVYEELVAKFPAPEYKIMIIYYENVGRTVEPSEL